VVSGETHYSPFTYILGILCFRVFEKNFEIPIQINIKMETITIKTDSLPISVDELFNIGPIVIKTNSWKISDENFFNFCQDNELLNIERNCNNDIIIMPPKGNLISNQNVHISGNLFIWNEKSKLGYTFGSNTGFTLPNNAVRSPDAAWIEKSRFDKLSQKEKDSFGHICPDFVIELKSKSNTLNGLKDKMNEWIENGCRLAWLINPEEKKVYIYRKDGSISEMDFSEKISGEDVLTGFEMDLGFMI